MPFPLSVLHVSIVALLVLASVLINHGRAASASMPSVCVSQDLANPLAETFPNNATGVLNATLAIIPIPLEEARRLIPVEYGILESAYRDLLPNFPAGMYPVMMQAAHDHDVQFRAYGITLDDFSVRALPPPLYASRRYQHMTNKLPLARWVRVSLLGLPSRWLLVVPMGALATDQLDERHRP